MRLEPCSTYSLILRDSITGWLGSAVASKYLAVGGAVSHLLPGIGVVHAQFWCCHNTANRILAHMTTGMVPQAALEKSLRDDPLPHCRQLLVMDMLGHTAAHTGADAPAVHAQFTRQDLVVAGNSLASEAVIEAMVRSVEVARGDPLLLRLIRALEAAEQQGGDHRGKQSAAIRILQPMDRPWSNEHLDLRVDDHPDPIAELQRLYKLASQKL